MNADYRPNGCDLTPVYAGKQASVFWIDRGVGLRRMFEEADRRLEAIERLCFMAHGNSIEGDCAADLSGAVAVLVEDTRSLMAAHNVMAEDNAGVLEHYAVDITAMATAKAKTQKGGKA